MVFKFFMFLLVVNIAFGQSPLMIGGSEGVELHSWDKEEQDRCSQELEGRILKLENKKVSLAN